MPNQEKTMTIKEMFAQNYSTAKTKHRPYSLKKIRARNPDKYSVDSIFEIEKRKVSRCDYFVLCDGTCVDTWIYLVEKKGKNSHAREIQSQLQGGANFINKYLQAGEKFKFLPVLVSKGIRSSEFKVLRTKKIYIGRDRKGEGIKHLTTGSPLENLCDKPVVVG